MMIPVLVLGCGNVTSDPPDAPPVNTASFSLTLLDQTAPVPLNGKARIEVQIARAGGFTGPITVAGTALPSGVTVTPATIAADATTAAVVVAGAAPLAIGGAVTFSLQGTGDGVDPQTVTLTNAPVTGKPGTLDTSFGAGASGVATVGFGTDDNGEFARLDVVNGSIVATGSGTGGLGETKMATIRFTPAGLVDPMWNGGVLSRSVFPPGGSSDVAVAVGTGRQTDGRSVIIGSNHNRTSAAPCPCTEDIAVVRFSATGTGGGADFGNLANAHGTVDLGGTEDVTAGIVLANSSIIAVGSKDGHFLIAQLAPNGGLDPAFAAPLGFERAILGTASHADSVIADASNRIVVAGTFTLNGQTGPILVRYLANGGHDPAFGTAGQVIVAGAAGETTVSVRTLGDALLLATSLGSTFRVRKFKADGSLDASFGTGGIADAMVAPGTSLRDMVAAADGSVLFLGLAGASALLVKLTNKGVVDTLFGPDGTGAAQYFIGDAGSVRTISTYSDHLVVFGGGNQGGMPGPGTFGVVARVWN